METDFQRSRELSDNWELVDAFSSEESFPHLLPPLLQLGPLRFHLIRFLPDPIFLDKNIGAVNPKGTIFPVPAMDPRSRQIPFMEFPEDVQLCILSFLSLSEIAAFACTSKRSLSLCSGDGKLWHALCDRRWGSETLISQWGQGKISFKLLYRTLGEWDSLIGFWRRSGQPKPPSAASPPLLVFFEWGPTFLAGSRVSPSRDGTYGVVKSPFLWLSLSPTGEVVNFLDPDGKIIGFPSEEAIREWDLIPVNVSFMGASHLVVEENVLGIGSSRVGFHRSLSSVNLTSDEEEVSGVDNDGLPGSLPDQYMSEMYQGFANRRSPGGNGNSTRQRKREMERRGRRKWEPEHFVKIVNCSPTSSRPLQGLWKVHFD